MSIDISKVPGHIRRDVVKNLGWETGKSIEPYLTTLAAMTAREVFECYCNWNGLIEWGSELFEAVEDLQKAEAD